MKQQEFEQRYGADWQALEEWLQPASKRTDTEALAAAEFPTRYRRLCHQLALAKQRRYSSQLLERLNRLALLAHNRFYADRRRDRGRWLLFFIIDFPHTIRANARLVALAAALLIIPGLVLGFGCYQRNDLIYSVMPSRQVQQFDEMYKPGQDRIGRHRQTDTDLLMFGFYIKNNIGIAFRTFAGGMLFGVGSLFFLVYNGIEMGAVTGYISAHKYHSTYFPFVIGHGAFELTAIVISGAAGLKLGLALLAPGRHSRLVALRTAGREALILMYGATVMLVIAAFLEGFWSSQTTIPNTVKYAVGSSLWLFVAVYFTRMGRARAT